MLELALANLIIIFFEWTGGRLFKIYSLKGVLIWKGSEGGDISRVYGSLVPVVLHLSIFFFDLLQRGFLSYTERFLGEGQTVQTMSVVDRIH